ncbi:unnamed protein product [Mesocestoides corti]|uniref:Uncharacterized protein n=2 Tax=Mesocestoides corti TaxID=53468 RepID=A0A0R3UHC8_MESCO|nr:unnamed protein product [Mesocestoides corti]
MQPVFTSMPPAEARIRERQELSIPPVSDLVKLPLIPPCLFSSLAESHYDYAPQDNPHSVSRNTGCEYGCCFTEQDLLIDVLSDESTPPTSTSAAVTSNQGTSVALGQEEAKEEEEEEEEEEDYFSLAARCLHQHLSDSLGDAPSSHTSHSPRRSSTSAATASLRHTAFLSAITATVSSRSPTPPHPSLPPTTSYLTAFSVVFPRLVRYEGKERETAPMCLVSSSSARLLIPSALFITVDFDDWGIFQHRLMQLEHNTNDTDMCNYEYR